MRGFKAHFKRFWFRLLVAMGISLIVSELGSMQSLWVRFHTIEFYYEYGATLFIALVIIETVHAVNRWLDNRFKWHERLAARITLQIVCGIILPSLIVFALASLYFAIGGMSIFETDYIFFAFRFIIALIVILNLIYIAWPFFYRGVFGGPADSAPTPALAFTGGVDPAPPVDTQPVPEQVITRYADRIAVIDGKETIYLAVAAVACIYIIDETVLVKTFEEKEYLTDHTLDELEATLSPADFFRINRKLIAQRKACKGYVPIENGKLDAQIVPAPPVPTTVSQRKAGAFKKWMEGS